MMNTQFIVMKVNILAHIIDITLGNECIAYYALCYTYVEFYNN